MSPSNHIGWSDVTYDGSGVGGEPDVTDISTITAIVPTPSPTKYEEILNHWPANQPDWATVRGIQRLNGVFQSVDDNAYGVRIGFQSAYVSPDWDLLSVMGNGNGGLDLSSGSVKALNDIGDVSVPAPSNGDALVFDSTTSKWVKGESPENAVCG